MIPLPLSPSDFAGHSITRRGKRTRLPRTPEERASPLHVASVAPMRVDILRQRMKPEVRERFDYVWGVLFNPELSSHACRCSSTSSFSPDHAHLLSKHGIAQPAPSAGPLHNVPFTVLEEKQSGTRQRFILWTEDANSLAEAAGYRAQVPLEHISSYLHAVNEECGATRDFRTGFYAVEIPFEARHLFRFVDSSGSWWELTRLPMGHTAAPEAMHTLAATAAGHQDYVQPEFLLDDVLVHVWIDNIRYAGEKEKVRRATAALDQTASDCVLTWKDEDSRSQATAYEFIGVFWDHVNKKISVSQKLKSKLLETRHNLRQQFTAGELETLGGRLLHASAVAGVFPGSFYFSLKYLRRITNALNRGRKNPSSSVAIPPSVRASLEEWIDAVLRPRRLVQSSKSSVTAFVDASKTGWGGVIVAPTGELTILGSRWSPSEARLHINEQEALALSKVVSSLRGVAEGRPVHLVVDNTTVKGVARKGACLKSPVLNDAVVSSLKDLQSMGCPMSIRWVKSEDNPADLPSRVPLANIAERGIHELQLAVRRFITGGVAGG